MAFTLSKSGGTVGIQQLDEPTLPDGPELPPPPAPMLNKSAAARVMAMFPGLSRDAAVLVGLVLVAGTFAVAVTK